MFKDSETACGPTSSWRSLHDQPVLSKGFTRARKDNAQCETESPAFLLARASRTYIHILFENRLLLSLPHLIGLLLSTSHLPTDVIDIEVYALQLRFALMIMDIMAFR